MQVYCICGAKALEIDRSELDGDHDTIIVVHPCPDCTKKFDEAIDDLCEEVAAVGKVLEATREACMSDNGPPAALCESVPLLRTVERLMKLARDFVKPGEDK